MSPWRFKPGMSRVVLDVAPAERRDEPVDATSLDASFGELSRRLGAQIMGLGAFLIILTFRPMPVARAVPAPA